MTEKIPEFRGFSTDIFKFLKDLKKNNTVNWFHKNRERYQKYLVVPAKSFIVEVAPFFNRLNPSIRTEPKFNHTIMRLNKDMRFAKGEPYRPFLLIHFGRFKLDSEFYLYFSHEEAVIGLFINNTKGDNLFFKQNLIKYKKEIIDVCTAYDIDNKYSLADLNDEIGSKISKFNASKHFTTLSEIEYILIQKSKRIPDKILSSDKIVESFIRMVSQLYPLYSFAISEDPINELRNFEESFGQLI